MKGNEILRSFSEIEESYILEAAPAKKTVKKPMWIRWVSFAAALCLVVGMALYRGNMVVPVQAADLMAGITGNPVDSVDLGSSKTAVSDFAVRLMQMCNDSKENVMISPMSILYAMAMTANGAEGETLTQMEAVLGMPVEELNAWIYSFGKTINTDQLKVANSIWFTAEDRFTANRDFLQVNADYYDAAIYQAEFDQETLNDVNNWVKGNTEGMIPKILDRIDPNDVMYLINAVCFEAKWAQTYKDSQIKDGKFTLENGTKITVDFMHSEEAYYLEDELATGFTKAYKNGNYAFVALLPNEGVTVEEYLQSLTGEKLQNLLASRKQTGVDVAIPKFESDYSTELVEVLEKMGMELAFDPENADFTGLGTSTDGNIYISQAVHKTYISVDEQGTKAAASTMVGMTYTTAVPLMRQKVILDRPFIYMIIDQATGIPVFIGTMMNPQA